MTEVTDWELQREAGPELEETVAGKPKWWCCNASRGGTFEVQSLGSCLNEKQTLHRTSTLLTTMKAVPGMIFLSWQQHSLVEICTNWKEKKKRIKDEFVSEALPWTGCSHSLVSLFKLVIPSKAMIQVHGDCSFNMIKGIIICSGILQTQQSRVIRPAWGTSCMSAESSHLLCRQAAPGCSQGLSLPATTELFLSCLPLCKLTRCIWTARVAGGCGGPLFCCEFRGYFPKNQLLLV